LVFACRVRRRIPGHTSTIKAGDGNETQGTAMRHPNTRFIQILRIELDDLKDDIDQLLEACRREREKHELGDHVYLENLAVFKSELLGIGAFSEILDDTDPESFETLEGMIEELGRAFKAEIESRGLAPAVNVAVERKIAKVAKYLST
jgi:hypothetical protein